MKLGEAGCIVLMTLLLAACMAHISTVSVDPDVLVEYHRSGGFAGLDDQLAIRRNGKAILSTRDQTIDVLLTNEQLVQIEQQLEQADLSQLAGNYEATSPGADQVEYILIYEGKQVRGLDTTMPEKLYPLLDHLDAIIAHAFESN